MKCAQCLLDHINSETHTQLSWSMISAAETIIDGMAVCLMHFIERMETE